MLVINVHYKRLYELVKYVNYTRYTVMMYDYKISELRAWLQDVAGRWDGKDSGILEDNATLALDVLESLYMIEKDIEQLESSVDY